MKDSVQTANSLRAPDTRNATMQPSSTITAPPPEYSSPPSSTITISEPNMDTSDWRGQFLPGARQRIVNKIMGTLAKHLPVSGQEGSDELRKIAQRSAFKSIGMVIVFREYLSPLFHGLPA
ncbi:hypothetical protein TSUD_114130 [Trifolium subterraneum]|uniref:Mediator complex subunit 15 KIX domain-containing protein n=1 Tax=Trifolium subterraneum TaxID=3900 RepID=A0A2Z6MCM5_TRISU|nr:hypothetical protein TSUD_114130 [Trifolium subterraneum]